MDEALARAGGDRLVVKDGILHWQFLPTGPFEVNGRDTESHIGELFWDDPEWETGPAIQVRDWVFCLLQFPAADAQWMLGAFHGDRFTACLELEKTPPTDALRKQFMGLVVGLFWPVLHPEAFDGVADPVAAAQQGEIHYTTALGPGGLGALMAYCRGGGRDVRKQ